MQPIPTPKVLDPNRILDNDRNDLTADHEARAALLEAALHESCAYAQQLWDTDNALRAYLMSSLPDPRSPGAHPRVGASPAGPDDDQGWDNWIDAYAAVTSVLCGPQGDSGFGLGEARHAAEQRRASPVLNLHARHPGLGSDAADQPAGQTAGAAASGAAASGAASQHAEPASGGHRRARPVLAAAFVLLVIRRLLPRRSERHDLS